MGIPGLYRWLRDKYPGAVAKVIEEKPRTVNGVTLPVNTSRPNPNGIEFDNLYLDINGIIHPCFHPEGLPPPASYEEVFESVFVYIDKLFSIVRPRKLLFLAIDGVAPRAKMNQQRSRRFRAAKEVADKALWKERHGGDAETESEIEEENSALSEKMDSNIITPGTEFMDLLSHTLRYYIHLRMNGDPGWLGIKVILSDATVPGEGEHKIMSYIRLQRDLPGYDPNTRHCLYGLDADLIMLALATHEVHFTILREEVSKGKIATKDAHKGRKKCSSLTKKTRSLNQQTGYGNLKKKGDFVENLEEYISRLNFQFLNIWVLREYLGYDMKIPGLTFKTDLERLIDDFIFMCMFVGNDFLPQVPTLAISEGAIDLIMTIYKKEFLRMGGYLTNSFEINLTRVEHFIQAVSSHECAIFRKRMQIINERKARKDKRFLKRKLATLQQNGPDMGFTNDSSSLKMENAGSMNFEDSIHHISNHRDTTIQLGEEGWKERYYEEKFEAKTKDEQERIRKHVVFKYIEGIYWVMKYYVEGVCSWQWFYPYHYAPFASDFYSLDEFEIQFTLGEPFKPFDQLMGVLPSARKLMTDASSPILDFYPSDFELDRNGKRYRWQAICKLPFIEEARLLSEIAKVEHTLTDDERRRNSLGLDLLFVHSSHHMADMIISFSKQNCHPNTLQKIDAKLSGGMNGFLCLPNKPVWPEEVCSPIDGMQIIAHNKVIYISYKFPLFHYHISRLPQGVAVPCKSVTEQDISPVVLWHETVVSGGVSSKRPKRKSVSGCRLANLSRRLVPTKQQDSRGFKQQGFHGGTVRLGGIATKVNSKKPNQSIDDKISVDGKCEERKRSEGDQVEKIKTGIQSRKGKKRLRKRKQNGGSGVQDKNVMQLDHFMNGNYGKGDTNDIKESRSCTIIEKVESCIVREKSEGDDVHKAAGVVEIEKQMKSKKRKRKSKKKKEVNFHKNNSFGDQIGVDGGFASADGFREGRSADPSNIVEKLEHSDFGKRMDGNTDDADQIKVHVQSKKRKRKSRKKKQVDVDKNNASGEQIGDGGCLASLDGFQESRIAAPNINIEKLEHSEFSERMGGSSGHLMDIKAEVKSKKRKRNSRKWTKVDANNGCAIREQGDGGHASVDAFQKSSNAAPSSSIQKLNGSDFGKQTDSSNDHAGDIKTQVKSKKRKRKSKKTTKIDTDPSYASKEPGGIDNCRESRCAALCIEVLGHSGFREHVNDSNGHVDFNRQEMQKSEQIAGSNGHVGASGKEIYSAVILERKEQGSSRLDIIESTILEAE